MEVIMRISHKGLVAERKDFEFVSNFELLEQLE